MRLFLVRHGQTHSNVAKKLDTLPPGASLTDLGREQAETFARTLASPPAALVSSVALRAKQTASYVEAATGTVNDVRDGLQETYVGEMEDRTDDDAHSAFEKVYRQWMFGELDHRLPGGESARDVLGRYVPVLDDLREVHGHTSADVVVVSHGAAIRLVAATLGNVPPEFAADNHLANTEAVVLEPSDGTRWRCTRWATFSPPFDGKGKRSADDPMG